MELQQRDLQTNILGEDYGISEVCVKKIAAIILVSVFVSLGYAAKKVSPPRQKFISCALSFVDTPYVWGGETPDGFDCSGFVNYVGEMSLVNKIDFPRTAAQIYSKFVHIDKKEREPGDLVFFSDEPGSKIFHVGIYCGVYHGPQKEFEGKRVFISAVSGGNNRGVKLSLIDEGYWVKYNPVYARFLRSTDDYNRYLDDKKAALKKSQLPKSPQRKQNLKKIMNAC